MENIRRERTVLLTGNGVRGKTIRTAEWPAGHVDKERVENRLVQMLKQTHKLTGFIPPVHFLRGGGRGGGGGGGLIKSMQLPHLV